MMHLRIAVAGLLLCLAPAGAYAQMDDVAQAARGLVAAAADVQDPSGTRIRPAAARFQQAITAWDAAIEATAETTRQQLTAANADQAFQLHVRLGLVYRARGRFAEALREFDAAAAIRPADSDVNFIRALTFAAAGRPSDAAGAFRTAWQQEPANPFKACAALQHEALPADERTRAVRHLEDSYRQLRSGSARPPAPPYSVADVMPDWMSRAPIVGDARTAAGFALLAGGHYTEGAAALDRTEAGKDASPAAAFRRAQLLEAEGRVSEARREYSVALTGALAGRSVIYVAIGRLARVEGDPMAAVTAYRRAVELNPADPTMRLELANAYAAVGNLDEAFAALMDGLLLDPSNAQLHAAIGQLRLDGGRPEDAVPAFTRALELNPDQYEVRYALATALTRLGRHDEAAAQLQAFERVRQQLLDRRRKAIQDDVDREEAIRRGLKAGSP